MEIVTENDTVALSVRIRSAKAEWREAVRQRDLAKKDYEKAEEALSVVKKRFRSAVGDLIEVAGANENPEMLWS